MSSTTIKDAQKWVKHTWKLSPKKNISEKDELLFLLEEIGEIAKAIRALNGNDKQSTQELEKEFGDVLLSLLTLANRYQIDLERGFQGSKLSVEKRYVQKRIT